MKVTQKPISWSADEAFSRNLGITSKEEQDLLRFSTVAIPGCGGVGSVHAQVLTRLGVGGFHLADFDQYEIVNFNRQFGARLSTVGRPKVEVTAEDILSINPEARVNSWSEAITAKNVDAYLTGVDLVIDSLDFFAFEARMALYEACERSKIPLITAAPLAFSTAVLTITAKGMGFRKYFDFKETDTKRLRLLKFAAGLAPRGLHMRHMQAESIRLEEGKGPSSVIGVTMAAAVAGSEAIKILTGKGKVLPLPHYRQIDAFDGKAVTGKLRRGNGSLIQKAKLKSLDFWVSKKQNKKSVLKINLRDPEAAVTKQLSGNNLELKVQQLVTAANCAPSGDNCQPWQFEWDGQFLLVKYDRERGRHKFNPGEIASRIALGAVLENIKITAPGLGLVVNISTEAETADVWSKIEVIELAENSKKDPLAPWVYERTTDRRAYKGGAIPSLLKKEWQAANASGSAKISVAKSASFDLLSYLKWCEGLVWMDIELHKDLVRWMRFTAKEKVEQCDGMPTSGFGLPKYAHHFFQASKIFWLQKMLNKLGFLFIARKTLQKNLESSAGIVCITTTGLSNASLIDAGSKTQRAWLNLNSMGYGVQPVSIGAFLIYAKKIGLPPITQHPAMNERIEQGIKGFQETFNLQPNEVPVWMLRTGRSSRISDAAKTARLPLKKIFSSKVYPFHSALRHSVHLNRNL